MNSVLRERARRSRKARGEPAESFKIRLAGADSYSFSILKKFGESCHPFRTIRRVLSVCSGTLSGEIQFGRASKLFAGSRRSLARRKVSPPNSAGGVLLNMATADFTRKAHKKSACTTIKATICNSFLVLVHCTIVPVER